MLDMLKHASLHAWIEEMVALCNPTKVTLCDGSEAESRILCEEMIEQGTLVALDQKRRPGCYLARSNPKDVARVEERTFICSQSPDDAGPTNRWKDPYEMKEQLKQLFRGCMHGRTLYVVPFSMGPVGHSLSRIGVQLTDSPYVVVNMRIMTRMGRHILDALEEDHPFVPCMHSVGMPLKVGQKDQPWPCNPEQVVIAHFPDEPSIWSFGSGYGGNALLGKKCLALRIASVMAKKEGWLAEHMLIVGVTNPAGKKRYFAAAFPSACGKTNLAMMTPTLPGWKVECVGDDIAWMSWGSDGRLYAINPEYGFFGVAPGTSMKSNPNALATCRQNTIFTNVALTSDGDVWWEGLSPPPVTLTSWLNKPWHINEGTLAAHPNSRFTAPASQCPAIDSQWEEPVPISGIIFGGRRAHTIPLVREALDWEHGVFIGASVSSEMTAAAEGTVGVVRHDPFAMLPFCGYHMGDYFQHWIDMKQKTKSHLLPRIFAVNWFRRSAQGAFLWPGFGENIRVLKWMFERIEGEDNGIESPIGYLPKPGTLNMQGLSVSSEDEKELTRFDHEAWKEEMVEMDKYLTLFDRRLPGSIKEQLARIKKQL